LPLRSVNEQVARKTDRADALQLLDLAQQRLESHPAGIGLQLREKPASSTDLVPGRFDVQFLEPVAGRRRQSRDGSRGEVRLVAGAGRAEDPPDP